MLNSVQLLSLIPILHEFPGSQIVHSLGTDVSISVATTKIRSYSTVNETQIIYLLKCICSKITTVNNLGVVYIYEAWRCVIQSVQWNRR